MSILTTEGQADTPTAYSIYAEQPAQPASRMGREQALQQVYNTHVEKIYKFVFFKVGNREDAEDITSQVFLKAAHSLDLAQKEPSRIAWLYQVARTTITDHWRGFYKTPASSLDQIEGAAPLHLAAEPLCPGALEAEEVSHAAATVDALLGMLPYNYRRVLELRFLQGCTLKETAYAMGVTEGNAKVIQHRALNKAMKVGSFIM